MNFVKHYLNKMDKNTINHILNILRQGTIIWPGRSACIAKYSRKHPTGKYKNGKVKYKTEVECQVCKKWYSKSSIEVDHIQEVGPFTGNFHAYILRMYCPLENLQPLCTDCHLSKSSGFNSTLKYKRKAFKDL